MSYRVYDGYSMTFQEAPSSEHPTMRATGLFDIRGAPIFECDILIKGSTKGVVEYDDLSRRFSIRVGAKTLRLESGEGFTVVGNAFEEVP